ncbi:MAG: hypothetical protein QM683_04640 [Lacrimispora sp.]
MKKWYLNLWPHLTIILSLFLGTLWVLNQLNPMMNFLDNGLSNAALMALILSSLITSASFLWRRCGDGKDLIQLKS